MRNPSLCTVLGLLALSSAACSLGEVSDNQLDPSGTEGRYIAILSNSSTATAEADTERLADRYGFEIEATWAHALQGIKLQATPETASALASDPDVAYVEADGLTYVSDICDLVPDLPECVCPGGIFCDEDEEEDPEEPPQDPGGGQITPNNIPFVGGPISATDKIAWVIDSGIDLDHPDLNVDVELSTFFTGNSPDDEFAPNGHGTAAAGIIAAIDNDIGVFGVSPGNTLVSVRTQGPDGSGSVADLVAGINYVVQNGTPGDVINMSVSAVGQFQSLNDAVLSAAEAGFLFSVSAGNAAQDVDTSGTVPASINHPNVFTVSAIQADGCLADFSNFGASVDITAPGKGITSTSIGGGIAQNFDGTSFSAPHVAGLLLHKVPASRGEACNDPDGKPDPIATF
ncbi:MAG TPA: S8 family serine peptidase [Kofleriaceae bacterium]|nr:S8 family serine peptidase [Kofleriaceae bacterium]